jgi:uncharacterized protein YndB with AHSA1/START domain
MTERSAVHATFVLERTYPYPPERVFACWSSQEAKLRWFGCHEGAEYAMDFRVGGGETYRGGPEGGPTYRNQTIYQDIIPDRRIVYSYEMYCGADRISVSLNTVDFEPVAGGTRLVFTEQGVFLDGRDNPAQREEGSRPFLDKLQTELERDDVDA